MFVKIPSILLVSLFNLVNAQLLYKNNITFTEVNSFFNNIFKINSNFHDKLLISTKNIVHNEKCKNDVIKVINNFNNFEPWALQMLDATGKLGSGILRGNIKSLGHYDECVETDAPDFTGQYCLSTLHMHSHNKQWNNVINTMTMGRIDKEKIKYEERPLPDVLYALSTIHLGVCVPSSCTAQDVQMLLNSVLQNLTQNTPLEISAKIEQGNCYVNKSKPWTREDFYFIFVLATLILLAVVSTIYNYNIDQTEENSPGLEILRSFSITENWKSLITPQTSGTFTSLDGIRVLSTFWVIVSHKIGFIMQEPWINKTKVLELAADFKNMPSVNSMIPVDTFFMTSGLLRGYNLLRDLQNKRHDFISSVWKRYLRLTPAVVMMIAFYITFASRLGSGPYWNRTVTLPTSYACRKNWQNNLMYINNYVHDNVHCVGQTWYLAADMQLFLVAPLLVYPIWRWPNKAKYILAISTVITTLIPFFTIFYMSAIPTYISAASNKEFVRYQTYIHLPTHQRAAAYIVGISLAYIFFKIFSRKINLSKITVATGWTLCMLMLYAVVYGPYKFFQYDYVYNVWEMALYGALHRPLWAIAVAWIVFACHFGYGGWINSLLSARIFQFMSKLSYSIYLVHFIVLKIKLGKTRTAIYMDDSLTFFINTLGEFLTIFIAGLFLYIFVEAPSLQLVKLLQKRDKIPLMNWLKQIVFSKKSTLIQEEKHLKVKEK